MCPTLEHAKTIISSIENAIVSLETPSRVLMPRLILQWISQNGDKANTLRMMVLLLGTMPDSYKADRIVRVVQLSITGRIHFDMDAAVNEFRWMDRFGASAAA